MRLRIAFTILYNFQPKWVSALSPLLNKPFPQVRHGIMVQDLVRSAPMGWGMHMYLQMSSVIALFSVTEQT